MRIGNIEGFVGKINAGVSEIRFKEGIFLGIRYRDKDTLKFRKCKSLLQFLS